MVEAKADESLAEETEEVKGTVRAAVGAEDGEEGGLGCGPAELQGDAFEKGLDGGEKAGGREASGRDGGGGEVTA